MDEVVIEVGSNAVQRYQVVRRLGHGGFGQVYEAIDRESGQRVALKELTAVNAITLAQFKHEFRTVQEVHHPNLVRLDALFEDRGKWTIAMELIEGIDLLDYLYVDATARDFDEYRLRDAAQLGALTRKARRLLDTVAIAGAPLGIGTCGSAAGVGEGDLGRIITELCQKKLLRRRRAGQIACFHDRIRHVEASR